jgi:plastocyanin
MKQRILVSTVVAATTAVVAVVAATSAFAGGRTVTVHVADFAFQPASLTVRSGTTVKWVWSGRASHDVHVNSGPVRFHSKVQAKGTYAKKLTKRGTYRIVCTIHSSVMTMTLKVR